MFSNWNDFDSAFSAMNRLRAQLEQAVGSWGEAPFWTGSSSWPRANLADNGTHLVLTAEVPGLSEKDVDLSVAQEVLTLSGSRSVKAPEGYSVHRQERPSVDFSRSFRLSCAVDVAKVTASLKDGVLTVTLPKSPESQPRQISVHSA